MRGKGLSPCFLPKARSPDSTLPLCFKDNAKIRNPESATHGFSRFLMVSNGFSRFPAFLSLMVPPNKRKYTIPEWG